MTPPTKYAAVSVSGVVTTEGGGPIPQASVVLGTGGHFSLPLVKDSTGTDSLGRYAVAGTLAYNDDWGCFAWVRASAPGHLPSSYEDRRFSVRCQQGAQAIDIALKPASR